MILACRVVDWGLLAEVEEEVRGIRLGVDLARGDGHSAAHSYIGERFPA